MGAVKAPFLLYKKNDNTMKTPRAFNCTYEEIQTLLAYLFRAGYGAAVIVDQIPNEWVHIKTSMQDVTIYAGDVIQVYEGVIIHCYGKFS